jgi:hypothetical protein
MATELEIKKSIAEFTYKRALVLFYKCRKYEHEAIVPLLSGDRPGVVTTEAVQKHVSAIYKEFGYADLPTKEEKQNKLRKEVCPILSQYVKNSKDLENWSEVRAQIDDELKEEIKKTDEEARRKEADEVRKKEEDERKRAEEAAKEQQQKAIPVGAGTPFVKDDIDEPSRAEQLSRAAEDLQNRFRDFTHRTERNVFALIGVIVVLVVVIGFLLIQRACQRPPVVVVETVIASSTPPPTRTPEPTQDPGQVVPPDTEVPPPPTAIPTETLDPTITFTPTITPTPTTTHTPTITPTPIEPGDDNLPLTFEGTYKVPSYYPFDMKLYIEEKSGDRVSGKFQWPDRNNRFQGWEGIIVHDFGDVIEQSKWEQVEGFGSEGTYIKETRKWVISAGGGTDGNYYFYISPEGRLTGVWFRHDDLTPEATIDLDFSE